MKEAFMYVGLSPKVSSRTMEWSSAQNKLLLNKFSCTPKNNKIGGLS